ncbi:hypothetical protein M3Y99_01662900 [Aphelenchoides fujianensis]|nr:hypothetical protein M3Y99_01662900 [Aphelenchoides fujianensis]
MSKQEAGGLVIQRCCSPDYLSCCWSSLKPHSDCRSSSDSLRFSSNRASEEGNGLAVMLEVGEPPQTFYAAVRFDSADLWLADESCERWAECGDKCPPLVAEEKKCAVLVRYDSTCSSTYRPTGDSWRAAAELSGRRWSTQTGVAGASPARCSTSSSPQRPLK